MKRGEVWWARSDQGAVRPFLVLTRQTAVDVLHSVHAVPATRTIRGLPTEVELDRDDGMPDACALALDNMVLLGKHLFTQRICVLSPARLAQVCAALMVAVDC